MEANTLLSLREVPFTTISRYFQDFQKHSKCYEFPPETAQYIGAFKDTTLVGYFVLQGYDNVEVEINQGYLLKEYRHFELYTTFMELLETKCKEAGYQRILLGTHNRFKSYLKFAKELGYVPQHLVFSKEL